MSLRAKAFSRTFFAALGCFFLAGIHPAIGVQDKNWPQWRGENLDSVSSSAQAISNLAEPSALAWRVELPGAAGASPIVWGERIFVTSVAGNNSGADVLLICFNKTGSRLWEQTLQGANENYRDNANSASPSPFTDGEHVWVVNNGVLHCFGVDGELVWKKDLQAEYGQFDIQFGMSTTPILDSGKIYMSLIHGNMRDLSLTSTGHVFALDAATGEQIWHQKRLTDATAENLHSYASPTLYRDEERAFLITHGADFVMGHSLEDGTELWRCGGINIKGSQYNPYLRFVASPVCVPGMIVVPTAKRGPVLALKPDLSGDITGAQDALLWKLEVGTPDVATPLIYQGVVYLADESGVLRCLDAATGEVLFQKRILAGNHRSTPVAAAGNIYVTGRDGDVLVLKGGPIPEIISRINLKEETTASVAIANGVVYVRTYEALYAFGK